MVAGQTVSHYKILAKLGEGGMGVVYKAEDLRLGRAVALKFLPREALEDNEAKARFVREAQAAAALDHPNICPVYGLHEEGGQAFIAMGCIEGPSLAEKIRERPLPLQEALHIAQQIAEGLAEAHEKGVIHRDIKPRNIMVTAKGQVKIADFGLAQIAGRSKITKTRTTLGTPLYMSPEQVEGRATDRRTDIWSLGIVLYQLLTQRTPFESEYEQAISYSILHEEPEPVTALRSGLPIEIDRIIGRALAKDPAERYQHVDDMLVDLRALRERTPRRSRWTAAPPLRRTASAETGVVANLPSYPTSFVGRERELHRMEDLLASARLLTLTGPPGAGKTRLSLQAARQLAGSFPDGVFFVSLAPIADPALVPSAIARALDIAESPGLPILHNLKNALRTKRLLLVLDNFEQVLDASLAVSELLAACPELKAMVTSRAPLQVAGEQEFPVSSLDLPRPGVLAVETLGRHSAVRLFVERAQAGRPDFSLAEDNARDVAELCIGLDGLPLAIELAAARVKLFSPKALLTRLGQRLDLLKGASRDRPARHQTLRQAIAWSYDLLDEPTRRFFRRLAVFAGGWSLQAAEALCGGGSDLEWEAFDLLSALADHSLIRQIEGPEGEPRFGMLETIRAFGLEQLRTVGEEDAARRWHAEYFVAVAERAEPELTGAEPGRWLDRLEAENNNFRLALAWAQQDGQIELGVRLGAALWRFWIARGHRHEGLRYLEAVLAEPGGGDASEARLRALHGLGTLCHYQGDYLRARTALEQCLELARNLDDKKATATALNSLGWVYLEISELEMGRTLSEQALALNQELGDKRGVALALNNLGKAATYVGDSGAAKSFYERSLARRREIGDQRGIAFALINLAGAEQSHGDFERASAFLDEALKVLADVKDPALLGWATLHRGQLARAQGKLDRAARILEEGLARWALGGHGRVAWLETSLGAILIEQGEPDRGRALLKKALLGWQALHCPWGVALNLYEQGKAAVREDEHKAGALLRESLKIRGQIGDRRGVAECFEALAEIFCSWEEWERAALLLAAAEGLREALKTRPTPGQGAQVSRRIEEVRRSLGAGEFGPAWQQGKKMAIKEAVALGLGSRGIATGE